MTETLVLVVWLAKATALLMVATGITIGLRRAPAGARHLVWLATFGALLVVPAVNAWSPIPLPILPSGASMLTATVRSTPVTALSERTPMNAAEVPSSTSIASSTASSAGSRQLSALEWVAIIWASITALLLGWLGAGAITVRRILRSARTLSEQSWLDPLYETADRLDLDRVPRLVMSSAVEMPFACSIANPTIVLPISAEGWTDARRRVVLFHELAHIRRRDLLGHTLGRIVCAFYWFHPLVWSAAKKLRAESERACDDLVLACGARASEYANHLLDIVTGVRARSAPATALPMANRREFEGRMLAILDPALKRSTPSRKEKLLATLGLGAVALTIAAVSPSPRNVTPVEASLSQMRQDSLEDARQPAAPAAIAQSERQVQRVQTRAQTSSESMLSAESGVSAPSPTLIPSPNANPSPSPTVHMAPQEMRQAADTALLGRILRTDKDAEVRRAAAWALQGHRDGIPLLLERLAADEHESVRETAAWALAGLGTAEVVTALGAALRRDASAEVRATAAWALGNSRGSADIAVLEAALGDTDSDVRQRALWAMGHQGIESVPAKVVTMLQDDDREVRLMAAWLLGQVQDKSTVPAVRDAFVKERHRDTKHALFRALAFMGDRSQPVIDHAMSSDDPELRARAVRMIAGHGPGVWPWPWPWPWPRPNP